jgi:hypothetical protein
VLERDDDLTAGRGRGRRRRSAGQAGGDGSQADVAAVAVAHGLPFVCIPAGTRNHSLDLNLDRADPGWRSTRLSGRRAPATTAWRATASS